MLLTVDVGNTNTVLGLFDEDELFESYRIKTDPRVTADELALMFRGLLASHAQPDGVAVCSTVPAVLHELRIMFDRYFADVRTVVVGPGVRTGVPLLYDNPREVGPDRVVNTLAAATMYGGPAIVVDFGTSTNFDVVSPDGEYVGGVLAPGIEISMDALFSRAARLFRVEAGRDERRLRVSVRRVEIFRTLRHTVWPQTVRKNLSGSNKGKNGASGRAPSCRSGTKKG